MHGVNTLLTPPKWNALPHTVVEAPSLNTFKTLLNNVAVCHVAVLP